jgi:hypothetical protein
MEEAEMYSLLLQDNVRELYSVLGKWIGAIEKEI